MYKNATVEIYIPVIAPNGEGTPVKTWGYKVKPTPLAPVETIVCDVQPSRLTQAQVAAFGITGREADAKTMFFQNSNNIAVNNRVRVTSFFPNEGVFIYEIKGTNHWPRHGEAILLPVIGES
jgi:hypothetical protein